ncbi:MAG: hypothetical protein WD180_06270 [Pseudohongiellaceae bacterium]
MPFERPATQTGRSAGKRDIRSSEIDLAQLKTRIQSLPNMDAARLVDIHHRLESRLLEIDAHEVADKLLDLEIWLESILAKDR